MDQSQELQDLEKKLEADPNNEFISYELRSLKKKLGLISQYEGFKDRDDWEGYACLGLANARADLCFAMNYMSSCTAYNWRLGGTVEFITRILGDEKEFKKRKARWDREREADRHDEDE